MLLRLDGPADATAAPEPAVPMGGCGGEFDNEKALLDLLGGDVIGERVEIPGEEDLVRGGRAGACSERARARGGEGGDCDPGEFIGVAPSALDIYSVHLFSKTSTCTVVGPTILFRNKPLNPNTWGIPFVNTSIISV